MNKRHSAFDVVITIILLSICCALAAAIIMNMQKGTSDDGATEAGMGPGSGMTNTSQSQVVNVSVATAASSTFLKTTKMNGEIGSEGHDIDVFAEIGGQVTQLTIKKGDAVQAGDVIATVDPSKPGAQYKASPVTAPVTGTVESVSVAVGATITTSTSIATIAGDKTLVITAKIPEKYLGTLENGMSATFTTAAWADRTYDAILTYISPTVDTSTRTVDIELDIIGDTAGLKEGMYISLDLITEQIDDCITVPTSAISTFLNDSVVYVVKEGTAKRQIVTTGSSNDTQTVILSGLSEGDQVIVVGSAGDGVAVNVLD
ncbi:MAG: efflux RND transporter periplasmic adaptor subunit [Sphaerochaetaceae bacterium]|jgi:membrane fusion protein (multidrug efflux system)